MSSLDLEEPWGQLVSIESEEEERIPIVGRGITIGRGKDVDIVITGNRFVSSNHCELMRGEDGGAWIRDTSTNGTLLNGSRLARHSKMKLSTDDIIRIVHRKDRPDCNVAYRFHDLHPPGEDATIPYDNEEATLEETLEGHADTLEETRTDNLEETRTDNLEETRTDTLEETEEHLAEDPGDTTTASAEGRKRPLEELVEVPCAKRSAPDSSGDTCAKRSAHDSSGDTCAKRGAPADSSGDSGKGEGKELKTVLAEKGTDEKDSFLRSGGKEGEEGKGDEQPPKVTPTPPLLAKKDSIEETLLCQICQEILHDCVSLQPCMHSYCGGCYSDWMIHSNTCPACRNNVERISKNHIVNNLVEAYLRANPDKKRSEEDLKDLDGKNKITKDMLYPKRRHHHYDDSDEDDSETEGFSSRSSSPSPIAFPFPFTTHSLARVTPAPLFLCRQCPGYVDSWTPLPSSSSHPTPPPFTCSSSTNHVLCMCCMQPMPDRRLDADMTIPPQKCDICGQAFCHMYWGCRKVGCRGCLSLFKDMEFDDRCLSSLINENLYESRVLKEYLESKGLALQDVLQTCSQKLDNGEYVCTDSRTARMSSSTRTCYKCALKNFKDLAYLYRRDIPSDDLPGEVTRRSDCYWGKNCRTQKNKPNHAERFNHICDQTRY